MGSEWKEYKFDDVVKVGGGGTPKTDVKEYWNGSIQWLTPTDVTNFNGRFISKTSKTITEKGLKESSAKLYEPGTVLMTSRATIGYPVINKVPMATNQGFINITCGDKVNNLFLLYWIKQNRKLLNDSANGTTFMELSKKVFKEIKIKLPPLPEQQKIASILSAFDDKIELNNEMNKTLEGIAQAIFKHWFIDFEFPNENGEPYKSSGGEFVDSELGPIPKGWKVKALDEIADFLNGLAMQKYRPVDENNYLPVLKIRELKQGATSSDSDKCRTDIDPRYIVDDGDVIFSWSGSLEVRVWCGGKAGLNQHLFKVSSEKYPKWFYYYWIRHHLNDFRRIAEDKATTMGHIKREHLSQAKVIVPDDERLKEFDRILSPLIEFYISNGKEVKILSQLRDTLLPKLISGEIRVM